MSFIKQPSRAAQTQQPSHNSPSQAAKSSSQGEQPRRAAKSSQPVQPTSPVKQPSHSSPNDCDNLIVGISNIKNLYSNIHQITDKKIFLDIVAIKLKIKNRDIIFHTFNEDLTIYDKKGIICYVMIDGEHYCGTILQRIYDIMDRYKKLNTTNKLFEKTIVNIIKLEVNTILEYFNEANDIIFQKYQKCITDTLRQLNINNIKLNESRTIECIIQYTKYFQKCFEQLENDKMFALFKKLYTHYLNYKEKEKEKSRLYLYKGDEDGSFYTNNNFLPSYLNEYINSTKPLMERVKNWFINPTVYIRRNKYLKYKMKYIALKKKLNL